MGVFIQESYPSIQDRVNRWNELGMLESIKCEESRKLVSIVLDTTSLYLMEFKYFNIDNDTKLCLLNESNDSNSCLHSLHTIIKKSSNILVIIQIY